MNDSRALVHPDAKIGPGVTIGPWSVIDAGVEIGEGTWIGPHVVIRGPTRIGCYNRIFQYCSLGDDPQDKKYRSEPNMWLEIGDHNTIREFCSINRGTLQGGGITRVGDDNWIMAYVHIAHDCRVGNHTVFANNATLAGHVIVEDYAILGGLTGVHQFCHVGAYSFSAAASVIVKDVPPYLMVAGNTARARGLNREGLRRHDFSSEAIECLRRAYRHLYRQSRTLSEAIEQLRGLAAECDHVRRLVEFIKNSKRGIIR